MRVMHSVTLVREHGMKDVFSFWQFITGLQNRNYSSIFMLLIITAKCGDAVSLQTSR